MVYKVRRAGVPEERETVPGGGEGIMNGPMTNDKII